MAKTAKSIFTGKARKRFEKRKHEDVQLPSAGGNLPAGIENGIARLLNLELRKDDGDKLPRLSIRGMAVEPKDHDGQSVEGIQDFFNPPGGRPKDEDEFVDRLLGVINALGVDAEEVEWEDVEDNSLFQEIVDAKTYFSYRTWQGTPTTEYPDPRVNRIFLKSVDYTNSNTTDDVEDATAEPDEDQDDEVGDDTKDWDQLAQAADKGDSEAQDEIEKAAKQAGVSQDAIDSAETWDDIISLIQSGGEEADSGSEEELSVEPEKEEIWKFKPPRARKYVDVEIVTVNKKARACNIKVIETGKTFKSVSWDNLKTED